MSYNYNPDLEDFYQDFHPQRIDNNRMNEYENFLKYNYEYENFLQEMKEDKFYNNKNNSIIFDLEDEAENNAVIAGCNNILDEEEEDDNPSKNNINNYSNIIPIDEKKEYLSFNKKIRNNFEDKEESKINKTFCNFSKENKRNETLFSGNENKFFKSNNKSSLLNQNNSLFEFTNSLINSNLMNSYNDYNKILDPSSSFNQMSFQNSSNKCFSFIENKDKSDSILSNKKRKRSFYSCKNENDLLKNISIFGKEASNKSYQNSNRTKNKFKKDKNNLGRKKKGCLDEGKHNKSSPDIIRKKIKTLCLKTIFKIFNDKLNSINDINSLKEKFNPFQLLKINQEQASQTSKQYNLDLLNRDFKTILSDKVTLNFNNKEYHNRDLINNLYKINKEGNIEEKKRTKDFIDFMNMKFKDFFYLLKNENNINDNNIIENIKIQLKIDTDEYLKNENEDYKIKFKNMLLNFPSSIENMKNYK